MKRLIRGTVPDVATQRIVHRGRRGMSETIRNEVWAFDLEWVPDAHAGRILYGADDAVSERDVMSVMWKRGGATIEEPRPFIKTVMCRIVSIAAMRRSVTPEGITLDLLSVPIDVDDCHQIGERKMLECFLGELSAHRPQLVGFNSFGADLKILMQRAVVHGLSADGLFERDREPFPANLERLPAHHVDLMRILGGWGKSTPSLHEMATLSGIPGKMGIDGGDVARLWLEGRRRRIVDYNEFDAVTTYLLWLRVAHSAGSFTTREYDTEQERVRAMLDAKSRTPCGAHMAAYLSEWERLDAVNAVAPTPAVASTSTGGSMAFHVTSGAKTVHGAPSRSPNA